MSLVSEDSAGLKLTADWQGLTSAGTADWLEGVKLTLSYCHSKYMVELEVHVGRLLLNDIKM